MISAYVREDGSLKSKLPRIIDYRLDPNLSLEEYSPFYTRSFFNTAYLFELDDHN